MRLVVLWIIFGLVAWSVGFLFVMILMRRSSDEDRDARHQETLRDPFSDVPITETRDG